VTPGMDDDTPAGRPVLEVTDPGLLLAVQDAGRPGFSSQGVTPGGAADAWSLAVANCLLGNAPDAAALEATLIGPTFRALAAVTVAVAGAMAGRVDRTGDHVAPGA
jgi:antagonist of KipI